MPSSITSIFIVVLAGSLVSAAVGTNVANGQLRHGHLETKSAATSNRTKGSLKALAGSCKCAFAGLCSCIQALEFMKCIQEACQSGACDCQQHHYFYACHSMSAECPKVGLKCAVQESSCKKLPPMVTESSLELVGDIEAMQARRCTLQLAVAAGWFNGKVRIAELEPKIQERTNALKRQGIEVPALGCSEEDGESFQEFQASLTEQMRREKIESQASLKRKFSRAEIVSSSDRRWPAEVDLPRIDVGQEKGTLSVWSRSWWPRGKSWLIYLLAALLNFGIATACAWIYDRYRFRPKLPFAPKMLVIDASSQVCPCGILFASDTIFCRNCGTKRQAADNFGVGLFACFSDVKLSAFACCCPCLRWADTVDRAGLGLKYYAAFAIFATLAILSPCSFGVTGILLALICFRYRQRLRKKYNIAPNNLQDVLTYLLCAPCAIVQEARVQANQLL